MEREKIVLIQESKEETGQCENVGHTRKKSPADGKKTYSGDKQCYCMDCGKSFTRKSSLIVHQRIHTGEKLFTCSECGKKFGLKSSMVRHMRTHTPKTLKICPDCGKCFSRYPSLFQHQKIHRKERLHKCPQCEKTFTQASQLVVHQRIHKGKPLPNSSDCRENATNLDIVSAQKSDGSLDCGIYFKEHGSLMSDQSIHKESTTTVPIDRNYGFAQNILSNVSEDCTVQQSLQIVTILDQMRGSFYAARKPCDLEKRVQCMDCGKSFTRKSSLIVHQRVHTGEKRFMCLECGKRFGLKSSMVRHMRTHSPKVPFQHQNIPKNKKFYKSVQYEKSVSQTAQRSVHERNHKAEIFNPKSEPEDFDFLNKENALIHEKSADESYICPDCGKAFRRQTAFIRHQRIHNDTEFGSKGSPFSPAYKDDKQEYLHNTEKLHPGLDKKSYIVIKLGGNTDWKTSKKAKCITCMDCGKSFTRKSSLIVHQRVHTGEKLFMCAECGKRFGLKSSLVRHLRTHAPKMLNICSDCGRCFSRYPSLFQHQKVHRREKPYKCPQCEKSFFRVSQLLFHRKTHKLEKASRKSEPEGDTDRPEKSNPHVRDSCAKEPSLCLQCGEHFTERHLLIRHQMAHTHTDIPCLEVKSKCVPSSQTYVKNHQSQEICNVVKCESAQEDSLCKPGVPNSRKAYRCIQCGKNYTRKSSLIVHQRIHTGEKLFICTDCGKRFSFKSSLVRHLRTHTGHMLNICSECGIYFSRYCDLLLHLENHTSHFPPTSDALSRGEQKALDTCKGGMTVPSVKEKGSSLQQNDLLACGNGHLLPNASSLNDYSGLHHEEKVQKRSINIKQETSENLSADGDPTFSQKNEDACTHPTTTLHNENENNISKSYIECSGKMYKTRNYSRQPTLNLLNNLNIGESSWSGTDEILRRQDTEKPFLCLECGKKFTRKSSLIVHQRTHTGEKLFMCAECGKRFGLKSSMVRHTRTHNTISNARHVEKTLGTIVIS